MIRVTIELISARTGKTRHLGTALIANDGTGTKEVCDYNFSLSKWGKPGQAWKKGRVTGFQRLKHGAYDLLYLALRAAVGSRHAGRNPAESVAEDAPCPPAPADLHCCGEPLAHWKMIDCGDEGWSIMAWDETDEQADDESYQCIVCGEVYDPPAKGTPALAVLAGELQNMMEAQDGTI